MGADATELPAVAVRAMTIEEERKRAARRRGVTNGGLGHLGHAARRRVPIPLRLVEILTSIGSRCRVPQFGRNRAVRERPVAQVDRADAGRMDAAGEWFVSHRWSLSFGRTVQI